MAFKQPLVKQQQNFITDMSSHKQQWATFRFDSECVIIDYEYDIGIHFKPFMFSGFSLFPAANKT